jgi:uncharacterized Ntn-hydrolase superfamily protein
MNGPLPTNYSPRPTRRAHKGWFSETPGQKTAFCRTIGCPTLTWSIIARDKSTGQFGIAVATRFFAVGAVVPHVKSRIGAIATQALVNLFYGIEGLRLLEQGANAKEVVTKVIAGDAGRDQRQVHIIDAQGRTAAHTGKSCIDWCGHLAGENFSVAGNMLAGSRVIEDTAASFAKSSALPFPRRLIAAMREGEAAGGDKRGKQSAALVICGEEEWPDLNLRVDDHADPLAELERLESVSRERFVHFMAMWPSRRDRVGITDRDVIERKIAGAPAAERTS